jgi:sodium/hydrogen antiporter
MALTGSVLKRLPLSAAMLYLVIGVFLGPQVSDIIEVDIIDHAVMIERFTEVAVIISLFTAGLKLRVPLRDLIWRVPIRLAFLSMAVTVGLIAIVGVYGLGLSIGAAILLGAVLGPTDPVLASDVQVSDPNDQDQLRFGLTGEAGFNDGTAFPFVMLGLGLIGFHELGPYGLRWVTVDLIWAVVGGLAIGTLCGMAISSLMIYLRVHYREAHGLDDFLSLGLIALSYGIALLLHTYGFLAVFAAGLALRSIERQFSDNGGKAPTVRRDRDHVRSRAAATHPDTAPAYMAEAVLGFNEQLERIAEVLVVILVGALVTSGSLDLGILWFIPVLLLLIRPAAVEIGLFREKVPRARRRMMSWFGIRGIGSVYYLAYAIAHGLNDTDARTLADITLATIVVSVVVHGVTVTPLMNRYKRQIAASAETA